MPPPIPSDQTIHDASQAVTEFLTMAFEPQWLRWERDVNLAVAETTWNVYTARHHGGEEPVYGFAPDLEPLHAYLTEARRLRWHEADWLVMEVGAFVEHGKIVFRFDMWWPELAYNQPCEMVWEQGIAGPAEVN